MSFNEFNINFIAASIEQVASLIKLLKLDVFVPETEPTLCRPMGFCNCNHRQLGILINSVNSHASRIESSAMDSYNELKI